MLSGGGGSGSYPYLVKGRRKEEGRKDGMRKEGG
jgi:hypothetical protein